MRGESGMLALLLCLTLSGCGGTGESDAAALRDAYHDMAGCEMEAEITCTWEEVEMLYTMRCNYVADGESTVEVLAPETVAGVRAILDGTERRLEYEGVCLNAGTISDEEISPAACLPRLVDALRDGWLLEENEETWKEIPCLRLVVDQTGLQDGKIVSTLWLRMDDGTPLRGEIAVDGEQILAAEFTSFTFCDTILPKEN